MNTITPSLLQPLIDYEGTALTIYMPVHKFPAPENVREDQIRFRNAIKSADDRLREYGTSQEDIRRILTRLTALIDDQEFWQHATNGMVIFAKPDDMTAFVLPFECEEHVCVGPRFDVAMALAACSFDQPYYVLALAVHKPKLFKGDINGLTEVETVALPESPEKALNIDEMFNKSNTIRGVSAGRGHDTLSSHGQGDSREAGNEERLMFFRLIDDIVTDARKVAQSWPLVLAGIDSEVAEYLSLSKHRNLIRRHVPGNHTAGSADELHELSWAVIDKELGEGKRQELLRRFEELKGNDKASADTSDIKEAVKMGRVEALLVAAVTKTRDSVTDVKGSITKLVLGDSAHENALNDLARDVVRQGGHIIGLAHEMMPAGKPYVAVYRY